MKAKAKSSVPRFVLKTGMVAASVGLTPSADATLISEVEQPTQARVNQTADADAVVDALRAQIPEAWNESKHGPELHKLIVKNAVKGEKLSAADRARLQTLQAMRRETLPTATSYESFIRERDRLAALQNLTDQFDEYVRKYKA